MSNNIRHDLKLALSIAVVNGVITIKTANDIVIAIDDSSKDADNFSNRNFTEIKATYEALKGSIDV